MSALAVGPASPLLDMLTPTTPVELLALMVVVVLAVTYVVGIVMTVARAVDQVREWRVARRLRPKTTIGPVNLAGVLAAGVLIALFWPAVTLWGYATGEAR